MDTHIQVLIILGSLRINARTSGLARYLKSLQNNQVHFELLNVGNLPLFNFDLEASLPEPVSILRNKIKHASAVIFASPQNNGSISGVTKNAYDWASRNWTQYGGEISPLREKKIGVISASYASQNSHKDFTTMANVTKTLLYPTNFRIQISQGVFSQDGSIVKQQQQNDLKTWLEGFLTFVKN